MASEMKLGPVEFSAVREITNIGLGHATKALSDMTGRAFTMSVPDIESLTLEEVPEMLGGSEYQAAGIYMPIGGDFTGHIAFLMSWPCAQALWRMVRGSGPQSSLEVSEMDASAMLEIGNVLIGSFLNALSDSAGLSMVATPPYLAVEMSSAILDSIVCEASIGEHVALALRTQIHDTEGAMEGFFVFIPSVGGLKHVFATLGIQEAA
jgi:chemotaxis protein CheC